MVIRSKTLTYTKIPQRTENLPKKFSVHLLEFFCSQSYIFLSKETFLWENGHEPIRTKRLVTGSRSLSYIKIPQKVRTSKRLFRVHFLELFAAAYGHPFRGGAFYLSQFGEKSRSHEVKVWPRLKFLNKLKMTRNGLGSNFWNFLQPILDRFK